MDDSIKATKKGLGISLTVCAMLLIVSCLFSPFYKVYFHSGVDSSLTAGLPASLSGMDVITRGGIAAGTNRAGEIVFPSLGALDLKGGVLLCALMMLFLSAGILLLNRRLLSMTASFIGTVLSVYYCFFANSLTNSVLYKILLTTGTFTYVPAIVGVSLFILALIGKAPLGLRKLNDMKWRMVSAGLMLITIIIIFLPFAKTQAPDDMFPSKTDSAIVNDSVSGLTMFKDIDPMLSEYKNQGNFGNLSQQETLTELIMLSGNNQAFSNMFVHADTDRVNDHNMLLIFGFALMLAAFIVQVIPAVDKWFAVALGGMAALILLLGTIFMLPADAGYQFGGKTQQLIYLGMGYYTVWPAIMVLTGCLAAVTSLIGVNVSDYPYFDNPIPKKKMFFYTCISLTALTLALCIFGSINVNLWQPKKPQKVPQVSESVTGLSLILRDKIKESITEPRTKNGTLFYEEGAPEINTIKNGLNMVSVFTMVSILPILTAFLLLFIRKRNKRLIAILLLTGLIMRVVLYIAGTNAIPQSIGYFTYSVPFFVSMVAVAFAAFFACFIDYEQLPKRYRLFLMALPFLGFAFVFSYLPLAGWRWAFYDYDISKPDSRQVFVGLKWFTYMFQNQSQRAEVIRVMKNTLGMSGIGLSMSWLPVAFAILLSEIGSSRYKKFVQTLTTLPNFISWVLVYSFALTIFSLDTGIFNKVLLSLGMINEPVAWLNEPTNIWLKMWAWGTWKGLGWGAIMYLAAISGIDQCLYEAAKVDGAGRWAQIRHITIPGILPTFFVLLMLNIAGIISNGMDQYFVFQNSLVKSTIEVLDLYVYNISLNGKTTLMYSFGTVISIFKSVISIVLLFGANSLSKLIRHESIV